MYSPSMPMLEKPDLIPMKFMMGDDEEDDEDMEGEEEEEEGEEGSNGTSMDIIVASQLPPNSQTASKEPNAKQRE